VTQAGRCRSMLFGELCAPDLVLDVFLVFSSLLCITPPHRSLVFTYQTKMLASLASRFSFITLLSSKPTGEATYGRLG